MTKKIFKSIIIVAIITLLSAITVITGILYRYFNGAQHAQLKSELQLVAEAAEKFGNEYFDGLSYDKYRITWMDNSGNVTYDSYVDAETMQNHSDREEFIEAIKKGEGSSTRYSVTLTEETIYEEEPVMETVIKVNGMMCKHCKATVERVCKAVAGVQDAVVDLEAKTVTVTGDAQLEALKQAIRAEDFEVVE